MEFGGKEQAQINELIEKYLGTLLKSPTDQMTPLIVQFKKEMESLVAAKVEESVAREIRAQIAEIMAGFVKIPPESRDKAVTILKDIFKSAFSLQVEVSPEVNRSNLCYQRARQVATLAVPGEAPAAVPLTTLDKGKVAFDKRLKEHENGAHKKPLKSASSGLGQVKAKI
jgi:hypothetical protein